MKLKALKLLCLSSLVLIAASCSDRPVAPAQVPQQIQAFVTQNFPNQAISYAEKDWDWIGWKYDVTLASGVMLSFDRSDVWDKVESRMAPIPAALVPAPIAAYVTKSFPAVQIVKIDKESYGYEVELANGMELKFNAGGALMEMDD